MPASCSFKIAMICSSLNLLCFIPSDSFVVGLYHRAITFQGGVRAPVRRQVAAGLMSKDVLGAALQESLKGPLDLLLLDRETQVSDGPETGRFGQIFLLLGQAQGP